MTNSPITVDTPTEKRPKYVAQRFRGPLPPPAILNQYDPATRKIIVGMTHKQASHRQFLEKSVILSNISNEQTGMWIAAFITIFMISGGIYLMMNDKNGIGFALIFGTSLFQAGNYIYSKYRESQVNKDKTKKENSGG